MSLRAKYNNYKFSGSYSGAYSFFRNRNLKGSKRFADVKKELETYDEYALFRPVATRFPRRQSVVPFLGHTLVSDLIQLTAYKRYNNNYEFVLVVLDGFSSESTNY